MFETWLKNDLKKPIKVEQLHGNLFSGDNEGNKIGVELFDNGAAASVSGSVYGYIIRADGVTVPVNGMLDGNKAYIVLPASAYIVVGQMSIVIKIGDMTVGACTAYVYRTTTDAIIDPGDVVPSLSELLEKIGDCQSATLAANSAASTATSAASSASAAAAAINNMTVSATVISSKSPPTVEISDVDSHKHITFGFPNRTDKANATVSPVITNAFDEDVKTLENCADNMGMGIEIPISPVQDLHGYASPWVGGAGKNLFNTGNLVNLYSNSNLDSVSATQDGNGVILTTTSSASGSPYVYLDLIEITNADVGQTYTLSCVPDDFTPSNDYAFATCASDGTNRTGKTVTYTIVQGDVGLHLAVRLYGVASSPSTNFVYNNVQVEKSSTPTTFAPYKNICPISGFTGVDISRTGRNLANPVDARPSNIIQSTTGNMVGNGDHTAYVAFIPVKPFAKYTLSATNIHKRESNTSNAYVNVVEYSEADRTTYLRRIVNSDSSDPSYTFTISRDAKYIRFSVGVGATNVQLEMGENVSDFVPYTGCNEYNITFPSEAGTVYGGTLTIDEDGSGKLAVDRVSVKFSDASWTRSVSSGVVSYKYSATGKKSGYDTVISSAYRTGTSSDAGEGTITGRTSNVNVFIVDSRFESTDDWLADVGNETLVYELASADEYTLTPQQITSLFGITTIWNSIGTFSVSYHEDPKVYVDDTAGIAGSADKTDAIPQSVKKFSDGADNLPMAVGVAISPVQSGSGDPSPSNIRPITGWSSVKISRAGSNLFDATLAEDNAIGSTGSISTNTDFKHTNLIKVDGAKCKIAFSKTVSNEKTFRLHGYDANGSWLRQLDATAYTDIGNYSYEVALQSDIAYIAYSYQKSIENLVIQDVHVYPITLPTTAYGGTLTVNMDGSGTLVVTDANIASYNGETLPSTWISDRDVYASGTTPTTGAQVVYKLASPVTYNFTAQQIRSLAGVNYIWADSGYVLIETHYAKRVDITTTPPVDGTYKLVCIVFNGVPSFGWVSE